MKPHFFVCLFLLSSWYARAQTMEVSVEKIKATLQAWNAAHNTHDVNRLETLTTPTLTYQGKKLTRTSYLQKKKSIFSKHTNYTQVVDLSDVTLTAYTSGLIKCEFTTQTHFKGNVRKDSKYLLLIQDGDDYLINGESDAATDQQLGYTPMLGERIPISTAEHLPIKYSLSPSKPERFSIALLLPITGGLMVVAIIIGVQLYRKQRRTTVNKHSSTPSTPHQKYRAPFIPRRSKTFNRKVLTPQEASVYDEELELNEERLLNEKKGRAFEDYVVQKFDQRYFQLKEWRSDKIVNGIYPESNRNPDLKFCFTCNGVEKEFEVECKFRSRLFDGVFDISRYQMNRYREYQKEKNIDVYLCLGLGGEPENPDKLFLVPLEKSYSLEYHNLKNYQKNTDWMFFMNQEALVLI